MMILSGDYVLTESSSSYEWGSWDKDYVVMSENSFSVLREIYSMGDAKLFIYDGRLYAYDYWWQNGFIHSFYTVYDLDNERMESRYAELYDIGIPEGEPTVNSENIIFADFFEVAGDIRSKTDTLFTIRSVENFLSKDPA